MWMNVTSNTWCKQSEVRARLWTRRSSGKRTLKQTIAKLLGNKMFITEIKQSTLSTLKNLNGGRGIFSADNCSLIKSYNHGAEWISPSVGKNHACIHRYPCSSCTWTLEAYIPRAGMLSLLIHSICNHPASPTRMPSPHLPAALCSHSARSKFISAPDLEQLQWHWNGQLVA